MTNVLQFATSLAHFSLFETHPRPLEERMVQVEEILIIDNRVLYSVDRSVFVSTQTLLPLHHYSCQPVTNAANIVVSAYHKQRDSMTCLNYLDTI